MVTEKKTKPNTIFLLKLCLHHTIRVCLFVVTCKALLNPKGAKKKNREGKVKMVSLAMTATATTSFSYTELNSATFSPLSTC